MKTLKDLRLKGKTEKVVEKWLQEWLKHFTDMADGARETVERYDLENLDFFYYTDCRDILNKNVESKGVENAESIRHRKKAIEYRLLFRKLLGEELGRKRPCSHCGYEDRLIDSLGDGTGHFLYCPKCEMTTIVTYPCGYNTCITQICKQLIKKGYEPLRIEITPTKPNKCRKNKKCRGNCK